MLTVVIQTKRHKKRLLYPAGLISLVLLPILSIWYLDKHKAFDTLRVMEINWWNESWNNYEFTYKVHPERKFIDINLTGNNKEDKIKLDFAQLEIRQLIATKDTIRGVHFHFGNHSKYWSLIRVFDICEIEKANIFVPKDNDVWVFNFVPRPKPNKEYRPICGYTGLIMKETDEQIEKKRQEKVNYIVDIAKTFWLSEILFIAMITLTIIQILKRNKFA